MYVADGYVYTSFEKAGVTPGYFMSVNFHGISKQDNRGPMGCVRFWYMLQGNCKMHLTLSQAYLSSATQLFYDPETMYELWEDSTVTGQWKHMDVTLYVTRAFKVRFSYVRFEIFTMVTMKNAFFWDVTPCGSVRTNVLEECISSITVCFDC
jgi:hypothetical protein